MADIQIAASPFQQTKILRLAGIGMSLRAIARALTRSEGSTQARAKADGLKVSKLR